MSIRTNPMKAVPTLLKHLSTVEKQASLNDLKSELNKIKDLFQIVKKNEEELLDTLNVVDGYIRNKNIRKLIEKEGHICEQIRHSTQKLLPADAIQSIDTKVATQSPGNALSFPENVNKTSSSREQLENLKTFKVHYNELDRLHKRFFLSLLLFPENAVIKKSTIHFWWSSVVGYIMIGQFEIVFDYLLIRDLIVPHGNGKCPIVNKFKVNPCVRDTSMWQSVQNDEEQLCGIYSQLVASSHHPNTSHRSLVLDQKKVKLGDNFGFESTHWRAIFNVSASYLNFGPKWMAKMKQLEVLQLGRWLHDSPKHHIEVESEEFFNELGDQKHLKYLSLRGISRIFELPPSIFRLESLAILDLKACHNLETLPDDIASLKNLRQLDLSQCYLLEKMPKGIEKLINLEVLEGFVIGSSSKTSYQISDLANLKNLERLSIHIDSGAVIDEKEFKSLKDLSKLEHLKISWGVFGTSHIDDIHIGFLLNLKKLHLEGFPGKNIPRWLEPKNLPMRLKELYLTGGKLESMDYGKLDHSDSCKLEIVRLKYLKHLNADPERLRMLFSSLRYLQIKDIKNHKNFEWLDSK